MWLQRTATVAAISIVLTAMGFGGPSSAAPSEVVWPDDVPVVAPDPRSPVPAAATELAPGQHLPLGWAPPSDVVVRYQRPAPGVVLRGFAPPTTAFGAGHRGVDLALAVGLPVHAAADGYVHHAGPVGRITWVSIGHADGILTSYGPLTELTVRRGDQVRRGQRIGRLASGGHGHGDRDQGLHWGARRGLLYLDPLSLLDEGTPRPSLIGPGGWQGSSHVVVPYEPWPGERWAGTRLARSPVAEAPGFAVPPSPNHLIMVAGLGSDDSVVPIDPAHLGYPAASVTLLSYSGRHDPDGLAGDDPRRDQLPYSPPDTWPGVELAAARLEDQLRAQRAREPGRAVDLIGHSMGGVVILYYLTELHDPYDPTLPSIGRVVTVASPHQGSDLAGAARWLGAHPVIGGAIELARRTLLRNTDAGQERLPLGIPAIDQLHPHSSLIRRQAERWGEALDRGHAGPLAMGTQVLAIGGQADLTVGPSRARLPDEVNLRELLEADTFDGFRRDEVVTETVLPGGHDGVRHTEAVREATWRFLAGETPVLTEGGLLAWASDEVGLAANVGAAYLWVHGGMLSDLRRTVRSPASSGPVEVIDRDREVERPPDDPAARWTRSGAPR